MNGPAFKSSRHDITIYRRARLQTQIPQGHRIIGDSGYIGEQIVISTPNVHDPVVLRKFKSRARARHESFNGRIKNLNVWTNGFGMAWSNIKWCLKRFVSFVNINWRQARHCLVPKIEHVICAHSTNVHNN